MYANYKRLTKKYSLLWSRATSHQIYWEKQQKMFSFTFFFYLWILQYDSSPLIHANRKQRKKEPVFCSYRAHNFQHPPRSTDNFDHILPSRFLCFKGKRCVLWCHRDIEPCLSVSEKCRRWMKIWSAHCFYWKTDESERNKGPSSARLAAIYLQMSPSERERMRMTQPQCFPWIPACVLLWFVAFYKCQAS